MSVWLASEGEEISAQNAAVALASSAKINSGFPHQEYDAPASAERFVRPASPCQARQAEDLVEAANGLCWSSTASPPSCRCSKAHPKLGPLVSTVKDKDFVDRWNNGEIPILAAHPESIGHGLNPQKGGHIAQAVPALEQ